MRWYTIITNIPNPMDTHAMYKQYTKHIAGELPPYHATSADDMGLWYLCMQSIDLPSMNGSETRSINTRYERQRIALLSGECAQDVSSELPPIDDDIKNILEWQSDIGIKCGECGKTDIYYVLIANRSADEGMSADCECRNCKSRFRIKV